MARGNNGRRPSTTRSCSSCPCGSTRTTSAHSLTGLREDLSKAAASIPTKQTNQQTNQQTNRPLPHMCIWQTHNKHLNFIDSTREAPFGKSLGWPRPPGRGPALSWKPSNPSADRCSPSNRPRRYEHVGKAYNEARNVVGGGCRFLVFNKKSEIFFVKISKLFLQKRSLQPTISPSSHMFIWQTQVKHLKIIDSGHRPKIQHLESPWGWPRPPGRGPALSVKLSNPSADRCGPASTAGRPVHMGAARRPPGPNEGTGTDV